MTDNIDRELILMCDTPEIQDRWRHERGSQYYFEDTGLITVATYYLKDTISKHPEDKRIYTPRIEDVLEWVEGEGGTIYIQSDGSWYLYASDMEIHDAPIKALLKAYMHLEHNKTWEGDKWIT